MFHKKEGGAGKRHRPFVMAYTGRWGTLPPTNVVRVLAPLEGAVTEGDGGMALRQYVAKVATPHPLRGSSPLGEPKSFGGAVCHCRGLGGGQPPSARYRKWRGLFGSFWVSKRNTCRRYAVKKVAHRKVVSHARSRIKNQSTPFSQATSAGFGWKPT